MGSFGGRSGDAARSFGLDGTTDDVVSLGEVGRGERCYHGAGGRSLESRRLGVSRADAVGGGFSTL